MYDTDYDINRQIKGLIYKERFVLYGDFDISRHSNCFCRFIKGLIYKDRIVLYCYF